MLFLGWKEDPPDYIINKYDRMRYDSMDGRKWNRVKERFPEVQLAEHFIHAHFLNQIDKKLLNGTLPEECAQRMIEIVVDLRIELEKVAKSCQLLLPEIMEIRSIRLLRLLDRLEEMARP